MLPGKRLTKDFFVRDVLDVSPELPGKFLVIRTGNGSLQKLKITEVEAYRGTEDKACHAFKGRTRRTEIMYREGGCLYVYFVYGMYWMLNIVTGKKEDPQAVLIRGGESVYGPGRLTKSFGIDGSFNGEELDQSERIWLEDVGVKPIIKTGTRIGIDYAGECWRSKPWRFFC
jgi:DNA-3-methyladenine glycosylase